jgi:nicotinamidase-related amidase
MKKTIKIIFLFLGLLLIAATGLAQDNSNKNKPALIIIDLQNVFMSFMSPQDQKTAPETINAAIQLFREHNFPVIRVYQLNSNGPKPDSKDFQFPDTILIKEDDPKIIKTYANAFTNTDLEKILREKGCDTLYLCGLSATHCVVATYLGAKDHGFKVFLIKDALLSSNAEHTASIQNIYYIADYNTLKFILGKAQN